MRLNKNNERGSVMVEVLAILALLGVMAPMLVRQIALRSQEVDNVNMASEIRTIAEGVDAYLQADRSVLESVCPVSGNIVSDCSNAIDYGTLCMFLPNGYCGETTDDNGVLDYYDVSLSGYLLDADIAPRPVYQALIIPHDGLLPSDFTLKRASRVASMIGVMGGIVQRSDQGTAHGTAGAWELNLNASGYAGAKGFLNELFMSSPSLKATYVALVTLSSFTPEVYTDSSTGTAVKAPISMGYRDLHAWNYFSVGQTGPGASGSCIEQLSQNVDPDTGAVQSDVIYRTGNNDCDPLFWVGTQGSGNDHSEAGHVYARNNLYIGRDNVNELSAIALEAGPDDSMTRGSENKDRRIVVYDTAGKNRVTIDATGRVVLKTVLDSSDNVKDTDADGNKSEGIVLQRVKTVTNASGEEEDAVQKEMVIKAGEIRNTTDTAENVDDIDALADGDVEKDKHYRVDLNKEGVSLLNDIRLGARKGAKLSELLPNYISKKVYSVNSSGEQNPYVVQVAKPSCPTGYAPALIVTPTRWDSGRVVRINAGHSHLLDQGDIANIAERLKVSGTEVTANSDTYTVNVGNNLANSHVIGYQNDSLNNAMNVSGNIKVTTPDNVITRRARFAVMIDDNKNAFESPNSSDASGNAIVADVPEVTGANEWTVKLGYMTGTSEADNAWSADDPTRNSISALAQTYCVYVTGAED